MLALIKECDLVLPVFVRIYEKYIEGLVSVMCVQLWTEAVSSINVGMNTKFYKYLFIRVVLLQAAQLMSTCIIAKS